MRCDLAFLTATFLAFGSATAWAAVIVTPPVTAQSGDGVNCQIANVAQTSVTVDAQLLRNQTLVDSSGALTTLPGQLVRLSVLSNGFTSYWCRFVIKGAKATVRGAVTVNPSGINGGRDLVVVPAQ